MRLFTLIFFVAILQENADNNKPIKFSIILPDTICSKQNNIPIIIKVENKSSEILYIRNPAHWGNALPHIKQKDKELPMIKVRVNPSVFNDIVQIKSNETLKIKFDYTLNRLFNLRHHNSGYYDMYFELFIDENKSINSDILRFYKK